ncbi:ATP synthase F1 subunit delta [Caulobacter sp. SL161]|nr:ATP synthase F1 subunit delta [Caulobacter sp. SL161]MCY1645753.1 ATP synthase F1 subunit delta [Caulobacter sp. SL161]
MADETKATDAGQRYAQSLFELTIENGNLAKVEADLKSLKAMIADSADLRRLIESPAFSAEDKGKGLVAVAVKARFDMLTTKFLGLVAANGRTGDLLGAISAFVELSAKHRGVVTAEVVSAAALSPAQLKGVQTALAQALGKTPRSFHARRSVPPGRSEGARRFASLRRFAPFEARFPEIRPEARLSV